MARAALAAPAALSLALVGCATAPPDDGFGAWREARADAVAALQAQLRREAGAIGAIEVHSGYREPALNACAGGAPRSAHALAFAIDFTPSDGRDVAAALCAFWREQGRDWRMGLGRYASSGRIHVDTAGHRAWGAPEGGNPCAAP